MHQWSAEGMGTQRMAWSCRRFRNMSASMHPVLLLCFMSKNRRVSIDQKSRSTERGGHHLEAGSEGPAVLAIWQGEGRLVLAGASCTPSTISGWGPCCIKLYDMHGQDLVTA